MARSSFVRSALALAVLAAAGVSHAATLRIAGANDILTFDPHAQNHQTTLAYQQMVYESLVRYNEKYEVEPSLATKWTFVTPTQLRFELRKGVKFHDGAPLTADEKSNFVPPLSATATSISLSSSSPERSIRRNLERVSAAAPSPTSALTSRSSAATSAFACNSLREDSRSMLRLTSTRSRTMLSTSRPT